MAGAGDDYNVLAGLGNPAPNFFFDSYLSQSIFSQREPAAVEVCPSIPAMDRTGGQTVMRWWYSKAGAWLVTFQAERYVRVRDVHSGRLLAERVEHLASTPPPSHTRLRKRISLRLRH